MLRAARRGRGGDSTASSSARSSRARRCGRRRSLAHALDTVQRVSGGRLIAGLGAGDSQIRAENEAFGLAVRRRSTTRLASLVAAVRRASAAAAIRCGSAAARRHVREVGRARRRLERVGRHRRRSSRGAAESCTRSRPAATLTWGGLVLLGRDDDARGRESASTRHVGPHVIVGRPEQVARSVARRTRTPARSGSIARSARRLRPRERRRPRRARSCAVSDRRSRSDAGQRWPSSRSDAARARLSPIDASRGMPMLQNVSSANHTAPSTCMMSSRSGRSASPSTASAMMARSVALMSCLTSTRRVVRRRHRGEHRLDDDAAGVRVPATRAGARPRPARPMSCRAAGAGRAVRAAWTPGARAPRAAAGPSTCSGGTASRARRSAPAATSRICTAS